jgi:CheY-like chemotaxis protein
MPKMSGYELLSVIRRRFPEIMTVAMSGANQGCELPRGVIADSFLSQGERSKILLKVCFTVLSREAVTITESSLQLGSLTTGMTRMECPL